MKSKHNILWLFGLFIITQQSFSQIQTAHLKPLTIQEAVKKAQEQSAKIKTAKLEITRVKSLKSTAWDFGETEIFSGGEEVPNNFEKNRGIYTTIGIGQEKINLFSVAVKNKQHRQQLKLSQIVSNLSFLEVEKEVKKAWSGLYVSHKKYLLYTELDSVFADLYKSFKWRYKTEEISKLEYLSGKNQIKQINLKKQQSYRDYLSSLKRFNSYFRDEKTYTVSQDLEAVDQPLLIAEHSKLDAHPLLAFAEQKIAVAKADYKVQKSEYYPKINAEYGFQKINGDQGFNSFQIGLSIPLIFNVQKGKTKAAKIEQEIAVQNYIDSEMSLYKAYQELLQDYLKWKESREFYQNEVQDLAKEQRRSALIAYQSGEIDYVGFLQLIKEAVSLEIKALETLNHYLQSKFELAYFVNTTQP